MDSTQAFAACGERYVHSGPARGCLECFMRRLLRDIAAGKALGDTSTLADPNVVAKLKEEYEEKEE